MIEGLIGRKRGMTQLFTEAGEVIPVTVLEVGPCPVVQLKKPETDGYTAVQVGFDSLTKKALPRRDPRKIQGSGGSGEESTGTGASGAEAPAVAGRNSSYSRAMQCRNSGSCSMFRCSMK